MGTQVKTTIVECMKYTVYMTGQAQSCLASVYEGFLSLTPSDRFTLQLLVNPIGFVTLQLLLNNTHLLTDSAMC